MATAAHGLVSSREEQVGACKTGYFKGQLTKARIDTYIILQIDRCSSRACMFLSIPGEVLAHRQMSVRYSTPNRC